MIGVYSLINEGETLLALCDNIKEFAQYLKIKPSNAKVILHHLFNKQSEFIKTGGKLRTVAFIEVNDDDN